VNNLIKRPIDDSHDYTLNLKNGYVSYHPNKVICYIDILGVKEYYLYLSKLSDPYEIKNEVITKLLEGFIEIINVLDKNIYSVHVISDSAIIVPKSKPRLNIIPSYYEFIKTIISLFELLVENNNPPRIIITEGQYFSTGINNSLLNILPGGKGYLDCHNADEIYLKGKGPGIYSNLSLLINDSDNDSKTTEWSLINLSLFKDCFKDIDKLLENINNIKNKHKFLEDEKIEKRYSNISDWLKTAKQQGNVS